MEAVIHCFPKQSCYFAAVCSSAIFIVGIKPNDSGEYSADWTWLLGMVMLDEAI